MITTIVFDVGGVLVRNENPIFRRNLEKMYGLSKHRVDELVFDSKAAQESTIGLVDPQMIWWNIAEKLNLDEQELQKFMDDFWACDQLDQSLHQFLINCRPKYKTALLTNAWKDARWALAEKYELIEEKTVDQIIISSEEGVAKPDEEIYYILKEKMGSEFNEILFIDDFIENIQAADELGILTIRYKPGMDLINTIELLLQN